MRKQGSCAEDRGRPCALQRQVPAVLRVRSGCASASVRLQRVGLSCCDAETGAHSANFTVRCRPLGRCHARRRARLAPGSGQIRQLCLLFLAVKRRQGAGGRQASSFTFRLGVGAHHTGDEPI